MSLSLYDFRPGAVVAAAGLLGAISTAGWAPFGWWPVAVAAYAIVYAFMLGGQPLTRSLAYVSIFSVAQVATAYAWILPMLVAKIGFPVLLAVPLFLAFCACMAFFPVAACAAWWLVARPDRRRVSERLLSSAASFSALFVAGEWLRDALVLDFASLTFGYAVIDTPLSGFAPITGVYGVSFVSCLVVCMVGSAGRRGVLTIKPVAVVFALIGVSLVARTYAWSQPLGPEMTYRLIQPSVAQGEKFDATRQGDILRRLEAQVTHSNAAIVLTPETAAPVFFNELPDRFVQSLRSFASLKQSHVLLGVPVLSGAGAAHNALVQFPPDGGSSFAPVYKSRLMPFGEYTPVGFFWLSKRLAVPLSDLSPGTSEPVPFRIGGVSVGALICLEDASSELARVLAPKVGVLVNPVNLAWLYGDVAAARALAVARMRAMEVARPILRAGNTGVTAHIDAQGRVVRSLPQDLAGVLEGSVQPVAGVTPFSLWGDAVTMSVIGLLGIGGGVLCRRERQRRQ